LKFRDINGVLTTDRVRANAPNFRRATKKRTLSKINSILTGQELRICIYRTIGGLGDFLLATPIARGAKTKYPNCEVTFAIPIGYGNGDGARILENNPYIDRVVDYKTVNKEDYHIFSDISFSAMKEEKPNKAFPGRHELFARDAGIPLYGEVVPIFCLTEEEEEYGLEFIKKNKPKRGRRKKGAPPIKNGKVIAIHLGTSEVKRDWPQYRIHEFVKSCQNEGHTCLLFGWGSEAETWKRMSKRLGGDYSHVIPIFDYNIRATAAILKQCDLLICPDSVLLHLGAALEIPTICLMGSQIPASRVGKYPLAVAMVAEGIPCLGCVWSSCPNGSICMDAISPQEVLNRSARILEEGVPRGGEVFQSARSQRGRDTEISIVVF